MVETGPVLWVLAVRRQPAATQQSRPAIAYMRPGRAKGAKGKVDFQWLGGYAAKRLQCISNRLQCMCCSEQQCMDNRLYVCGNAALFQQSAAWLS
ncbi:hypothetical protein QJQ45_021847 [Haematococcus lacustris]|nr:hypothetical protein QJQ45_021847 [Haematococcus lacustris]